ncbi:hypothetical protein H6G89_04445 [Oscillatoria sp. FACHB-1407]|uniref:hypothetical protein n=1 Tax=Oscillatoria sp. FACHB-1407 TaxID=2692847 RepID=UPI0016881AF9|nr:hypothetical protein [Oscillatoria sp. FACHB-1407]MBD2460287.1 hypothetical protein [Oscillatoria sp. FACHB-1407]
MKMIHVGRKIETNRVTQASDPSSFVDHCATYIGNIVKMILNVFGDHQKSEPRIIQLQDRNGEVFWEIHDFQTGETIYCMTEDDVRHWLDTPQYRHL